MTKVAGTIILVFALVLFVPPLFVYHLLRHAAQGSLFTDNDYNEGEAS